MVDYAEETEDLATGQAKFNPPNPVYVLNPTPIQNGVTPATPEQEREEYQVLEEHEVMWTGSPYLDEDSEPDEDEEDEDGGLEEEECEEY